EKTGKTSSHRRRHCSNLIRKVTVSGVAPFKPLLKRRGIVYLQGWAKTLDGINGHKVAAGKRLKSHDEWLMLIIPVVGRYNMLGY
ncbi:hypothetical protein A2U01_0047747, partial [Trifolium medium]|nr:hypothetical protein [Trifolium medium]